MSIGTDGWAAADTIARRFRAGCVGDRDANRAWNTAGSDSIASIAHKNILEASGGKGVGYRVEDDEATVRSHSKTLTGAGGVAHGSIVGKGG